MKKIIIAGATALVLAGSTAAYAQYRPWSHHGHSRFSTEDRAAFADAKIAAVKAGLKLTPDQEKLWPPLEAAVRDFAKLRIDRANARMEARRDDDRDRQPSDPVTRLRDRADAMATTAAAMKRIAETADPLYRTLDDAQKRRLSILTGMGGKHGHRGEMRRGRDDDDRRGGWQRGSDRERGERRDRHDGRDGAERL